MSRNKPFDGVWLDEDVINKINPSQLHSKAYREDFAGWFSLHFPLHSEPHRFIHLIDYLLPYHLLLTQVLLKLLQYQYYNTTSTRLRLALLQHLQLRLSDYRPLLAQDSIQEALEVALVTEVDPSVQIQLQTFLLHPPSVSSPPVLRLIDEIYQLGYQALPSVDQFSHRLLDSLNTAPYADEVEFRMVYRQMSTKLLECARSYPLVFNSIHQFLSTHLLDRLIDEDAF